MLKIYLVLIEKILKMVIFVRELDITIQLYNEVQTVNILSHIRSINKFEP